ncbi:hypothetical protein N9K98_08575 [Luminiphilus sp.]|nr:hypothetical protein [Luminiphilus sp.]
MTTITLAGVAVSALIAAATGANALRLRWHVSSAKAALRVSRANHVPAGRNAHLSLWTMTLVGLAINV